MTRKTGKISDTADQAFSDACQDRQTRDAAWPSVPVRPEHLPTRPTIEDADSIRGDNEIIPTEYVEKYTDIDLSGGLQGLRHPPPLTRPVK